MTVAAPTLYWYQLEVGTYIPTYFTQLDTSVRALCAANSVTAPPTLLSGLTAGGYVSAWLSGTDKAVRSLCTVLSVTPPIAMNQTAGQFEPTYLQSLDTAVRALCNAGSPYTGPLDIVGGAVVAYGQRALSSAKRGSALYTIRRDSDDTTQSFNSDATTGAAPVSAISSFIGAGNGFATVWNDQSGNSVDVSQATAANEPVWLANALNSQPAMSFTAAAPSFLQSATNAVFASGRYTFFSVINCSLSGDGQNFICCVGDDLNGPDIQFDAIVGNSFFNTPIIAVEADDSGFNNGSSFSAQNAPTIQGVYTIVEAAWGPSTGSVCVNGASVAASDGSYGTNDAGPMTAPVTVGADHVPGGSPFDGKIVELVVYNSILSDANRLAIRQNIAAYYGITLG